MQEDKSWRQNPQALGKGELQGRLLEHGGGRNAFPHFPSLCLWRRLLTLPLHRAALVLVTVF